MNDMKGRNRAPPTAEGQAALRVGVHLKRHIDVEKQGYHLLWTTDGGRNLRRRSQIHPESFHFPPPPVYHFIIFIIISFILFFSYAKQLHVCQEVSPQFC